MRKLNGVGLPNIYLCDGYEVATDVHGDQLISYQDVEGLYRAIGRAIAVKPARLSGAELRFLRKRLGWTQGQFANLGDKSSQTAAKWEKGELPVAVAEANLLRFCWLGRHSPEDLPNAVASVSEGRFQGEEQPLYAFSFRDGRWTQNDVRASEFANEIALAPAEFAIRRAMSGAVVEERSTSEAWIREVPGAQGLSTKTVLT